MLRQGRLNSPHPLRSPFLHTGNSPGPATENLDRDNDYAMIPVMDWETMECGSFLIQGHENFVAEFV